MAVTITIRNVPENVRNELATRAAVNGRSLQQFLLHELIDLASKPDRQALIAAISGDLVGRKPIPVHDILAARDASRFAVRTEQPIARGSDATPASVVPPDTR